MNTETPGERTLVVGVELSGRERNDSPLSDESASEDTLAELETLAASAGAVVVGRVSQLRQSFSAATLVGSGKLAEIQAQVDAEEIDTVIFDHELSATQLRNLERQLHAKVIDRTQLILDIFARRARTAEGQLQVELAQLTYLLPRLAGRGTQMSRLGGGIGTRGPGETQLETDRRRIGKRIAKLKADIERVRATRETQRSQRQAVPLSTVALVGYTNAGKSTLFNRLTGAGVTADARMFATLDPTVRQLQLPSHRRVLVSDTVGFIRNLPTTLVDAFRATLEEVSAAALLLHVVDVASPLASEHTNQVIRTLREIGADASRQILVLNKSDQLPGEDRAGDPNRLLHRLLGETARQNQTQAVLVSGHSGEGVDRLRQSIDEELKDDPVERQLFRLPIDEGRALNLLYDRAAVVSRVYAEGYCEVVADAPRSVREHLARYAAPAPR